MRAEHKGGFLEPDKKTRNQNIAVLVFVFVFLCIPASSYGEPEEGVDSPPKIKNKFQRSKLTRDETEKKADRRRLLLATGEDRTVDLDFELADHDAIAKGNPQVIGVTPAKIGDQTQLVFKPLKSGETTVTVRDKDGTLRLVFDIIITGSNLLRRANEVRQLLKDIEGIDIKVVGQKIIVDGEVLVPADYGRILSVILDKVYVDSVMNLTTISPLAMQALSRRIQEDINSFAQNVKTRVVNGQILLEGTVDNQDQANRSLEVAKIYLPEVRPLHPIMAKDPSAQFIARTRLIQNFIVINPPPPKKQEKLVRVSAHFVELAKDYEKFFGFSWKPLATSEHKLGLGQNTEGALTTQGSSFTATISNLLPKLKSAQNAGFARVLKTATILTRSGQPAKLDERTNIPFTMIGANGQAVSDSREVGVLMALTPLILGQSEDIQMDLIFDQTTLAGRAPSGGAPLTAHHRVESKIYVKSNESAAVAGVVASDLGTDFNKGDPGAGTADNPNSTALFDLLRSKQYRKKKSQFVIFVTPQIIENASDGTEDLKKNFKIKVK